MKHKSTPPAVHNSDSAAHRWKIRTHILAKSYVDLNKARTVFVVLLWRGYVPTRYCPHLQKLHSWNEYSFAQGKYADKNCTGDSTPDSQPKRHGQEKCLSLDECIAAHFTTSTISRFGHPKTENTKQTYLVAKIVLALPDGVSSHMHASSNMRWVVKSSP